MKLITDTIEVEKWLATWKDEIVEIYVSKDGKFKNVPRLNGTYTIRPDGVVDVEGSINLYEKGLEYIPIQFGEVGEDFYCSFNQLTSLQGCPTSVGGNFFCSYNPKLTTLQYCPTSVSGDFFCAGNQLTTLQYCPTSVGGDFWCSRNPKLITKEHNSNIKGIFYSDEIEGILEERILRYIEYLKPLNQQERDSSLTWLGSVDECLYNELLQKYDMIKFAIYNEITLITDKVSDRVKSIYTKTNTQNKRMPLL